MTRCRLGIVLAALVACSPRSVPETVPGPALGESTAGLPVNPSAPNPDASEPVPVSGRLSPQATGAAQAPIAAPADPGAGVAPEQIGAAAVPGAPIAADGGVAPNDAGVTPADGGARPGVSDAGTAVFDGGTRPGLSDAGGPR